MKQIHEPLTSLSSYLKAAFVINYKEFKLRIKNNKTRFLIIIIIGLVLMLLNRWIGWGYYLLLVILIAGDFINEIISFRKLFLFQKKLYPEGIIIVIDDLGFKKKTQDGREWRKIFWKDISLTFDNKRINNIALYDKEHQEYHLFFTEKMLPSHSKNLKDEIQEKIKFVH